MCSAADHQGVQLSDGWRYSGALGCGPAHAHPAGLAPVSGEVLPVFTSFWPTCVLFCMQTAHVENVAQAVSWIGLVAVVGGEALRLSAMLTARGNFTHMVRLRRSPGHQLVTTGVYAWLRHPGGWASSCPSSVSTQTCRRAIFGLFTCARMQCAQAHADAPAHISCGPRLPEWLKADGMRCVAHLSA